MDAGIADTLNRLDAEKIAKQLDLTDWFAGPGPNWANSSIAKTLMSENTTSNADRAWLVGYLAERVPDLHFDGSPADADWDNLFSHIRAEILARRDRAPQTPPVPAA